MLWMISVPLALGVGGVALGPEDAAVVIARYIVEASIKGGLKHPDQSGFMPANLITLAHLSASCAIMFLNSAGEPTNVT